MTKDFTREYASDDLPVNLAATIDAGQPRIARWLELPDGGSVTFEDATGTEVAYTDCPAGYRAAVEIRKLVDSSGRVRVGTNPAHAMAPSIPSSIGASQLAGAAADPDAIAPMFVLRVAFTAGTTGSADDVTVLASAPFDFRILDAFVYVSTEKSGATATLRSAASGGGSALSDAFDVSAQGIVRNESLTSSKTVAADGAIYLRRSDRACAGEVVLLCAKS